MIAKVSMFLSLLAPLVASALLTTESCAITFEGRVPNDFTVASFDASTSPYNPGYVIGENLKWSSVLQFPTSNKTLFDKAGNTKAVEVTISDKSIFAPSSDNRQTGFRRAELLPAGGDAIVTGKKTLHFSVSVDSTRPLNYSHEYQLVFVESADYSTNQVVLKTGTMIGSSGTKSKTLQLQGNQKTSPPKVLFQTDLVPDTWYNFGLVLDFNSNTVEVLFSTGTNSLASKTSALSNDLSGKGEWHFGILKKPTNPGSDVTKSGYQESGINEGVSFGGIFFEDSSSGCTSLQ